MRNSLLQMSDPNQYYPPSSPPKSSSDSEFLSLKFGLPEAFVLAATLSLCEAGIIADDNYGYSLHVWFWS